MQIRRCARNCMAEAKSLSKSDTCLSPSSVSPAGTSRGAWVRLGHGATHPSVTACSSTEGMTMIQAPIDTPPIITDEIVITAARASEEAADSAASVTVIAKIGHPVVPTIICDGQDFIEEGVSLKFTRPRVLLTKVCLIILIQPSPDSSTFWHLFIPTNRT